MSGILLAAAIGGAVVTLSAGNPNADAVQPATAAALYALANNGNVVSTNDAAYKWLTGGLASNYEVFATLNSGTLSSGTTGSWLNLGGSPQWEVDRSTIGTKSAAITLQIRMVGTTTILATATINFTATQEA